MDKILSKSKYLAGLQCLKYLWQLVNEPDSIPPFDDATQFRFKQGHEVEKLAKSLFPDGIEIGYCKDIKTELEKARRLTYPRENHFGRKPLFEVPFTYKNSFAIADILEPGGKDWWNIIEVKAASSIKDINMHDAAFQRYCYDGAGLEIDKFFLMYLNRDFEKDGTIDPSNFFIKEDVTKQTEKLMGAIEEKIETMLDAIRAKNCPEIEISENCYKPYTCPLKDSCWRNLPDNSVFELYRGKRLAFSFYKKGITRISDIHDTAVLNPIQSIQHKTIKENNLFVDSKSLDAFLRKLRYPLYFLDFETFSMAIPLFDGVRPYQNIPFQFSCHIIESPGSKTKNLYFLADNDGKDPRPVFLSNLKEALGYNKTNSTPDPSGSILVYYESFEKTILKELSRAFPEHRYWIGQAVGRIIDLYEPFGKFYYYNSEQKGSASLKTVLPALTGISYDDMEIKNGSQASLMYLKMAFLKEGSTQDCAEAEKIKKDLVDYCGLDTEGMIFILKELYNLVDGE